MASFNKVINVSKSVNSICKALNVCSLNSISFNKPVNAFNNSAVLRLSAISSTKGFHTTHSTNGLTDFFDVKKNWGENEVRSGKSWKLEELRIKSNSDLHKLWYVLLKEKNMLLTMEYESNEKAKLFPSPERIDKVEESMKNLETVVRERNTAYHLLETGIDGERPKEMVTNQMGFRFLYKHTQHLIPKQLNTKWKERHVFTARGNAATKFLSLYKEKIYVGKRKKLNRDRNHVMGLIRRFPNMDMDALKAHYPDVDIEKCKNNRKARGHYVPK